MINFLLVVFGLLGIWAMYDLIHVMVNNAKEEKELQNERNN